MIIFAKLSVCILFSSRQVAARLGFWRRQRSRDQELTDLQFKLTQKILYSSDKLKLSRVEELLDRMVTKVPWLQLLNTLRFLIFFIYALHYNSFTFLLIGISDHCFRRSITE